jgi:magnesium transporter
MSMKSWQRMTKAMCDEHPETAAKVLEGIEPAEAARLMASLSKTTASQVMERMAPAEAARLFDYWNEEETKTIAVSTSAQTLGVIWQRMTPEQRDRLAAIIGPDELRQLQRYAGYVPDSVGGMADPRVLMLREDLTVREAINRIRRASPETVYYLYVVDAARHLVGVVHIRDLLLADTRTRLSDLMVKNLTTLKDTVDREEAVNIARSSQFQTLPVVDSDGRFIGVVKTDDLLRAAQQEASEDVQKLFGAGADEHALSPISFSVRARLPWLVVNLGTAFLASAVVGMFTETISALPLLAVFMPIVAGQGGNTGAQSLAVIIRGLALREVDPSQRARAVAKETLLGFINGLAIAVITALGAVLWSGKGMYGVVIGIAMVVNMVAAGFSGALIPIALKSMGRDPAQSSSIIQTTVTDVVGFLVFLGLGTLLATSLK